MKKSCKFFRGCLIGGAVGDALGWPVEFLTHQDILNQYGKYGICDLEISNCGKSEITDDTQMTLFTAEGILRSETLKNKTGNGCTTTAVYYSYLRWLNTQGYPTPKENGCTYDGWLINVKDLHARRAPGNTCISALSCGNQGTIERPLNSSKGCGGIMRTAPAGLFYPKETAFIMGAEFAAITHGHPSGYLSAGALAYMIACIIEGQDIGTSVINTINELAKYKNHEECLESLKQALELSESSLSDIDAISRLGEGWVGEEALSISAYCALRHRDDFKKALISAVNHDGDSDSTGAITGNILGAYLGIDKIPPEWVNNVELKDIVTQAADDLLTGYHECSDFYERYPV